MPRAKTSAKAATAEANRFGLVCLSSTDECRYRALTLTRFRSLARDARLAALRELYWDNLRRLHWTLGFCVRRGIRLYRVTSGLFPMADQPEGERILSEMAANLSAIGRRIDRLNVRMLIHPDQFVVLNSDRPEVIATSRTILEKHARVFDLMGLPQTPWAAIIIHGGKAARADKLADEIATLPAGVRNRLCLENDEYAYSAAEILAVCRQARVPMIFDNLHHAVHDELDSYDHPSVRKYVLAARETWRPHEDWQIVHLSNGHASFRDRNHSELIADVPHAYHDVPWIEVEARGKERAIAHLQSGQLRQRS